MKDLYTIERGSPDKPPVLLLHGVLGSARNLVRLMDAIAATGFYVLAYDQQGHGHSPHAPSSADYTLDALALDVWDVLDKFRIASCHLAGHSMGARVCLAASGLQPERVKSLTMLDSGIKMSDDAYREIHNIIDPLPDSFESRAEAENLLSNHSQGLRQFLVSNLRPSGTGRYRWMFDLRNIRDYLLETLRKDQSSSWKKLNSPILVARGENSTSITDEELAMMLSLNSNAQGRIIPRAGHWVHVDNFDGTVELITQFLKSVES